jgi:hypothetical protein
MTILNDFPRNSTGHSDWFGEKQPSMENVRHTGRIVFANSKLNMGQAEAGRNLWLFSWTVTLWLEKHFKEIAAEFNRDRHKIQGYYRRFFYYQKIAAQNPNNKEAGGTSTPISPPLMKLKRHSRLGQRP